jgi:hypothetical protein
MLDGIDPLAHETPGVTSAISGVAQAVVVEGAQPHFAGATSEHKAKAPGFRQAAFAVLVRGALDNLKVEPSAIRIETWLPDLLRE